MKQKTYILSLVLGIMIISYCVTYAASLPTLNLVGGGTNILVTVSDGKPNSNIMLYYPSGSVTKSVNLGTTNSSGYFSQIVSANKFDIPSTVPVYAVIDGIHSPTATWPRVASPESNTGTTYDSGGSLFLSQTSVNGIVGASVGVAAMNVNGTLSVPSNTSPAVASASIVGNTVTIVGLTAGNTTLTVCASGSGCGTIYITIQPSTQTQNSVQTSTDIFGTGSVSLVLGETKSISLNGVASYSISSNSNPGVSSAVINSSVLNLVGLTVGNTSVVVCQANGTCGSTTVSVTNKNTQQASSLPVAITSISVTSNKTNDSILKTGNILTLSFSTNQPVIMPTIAVGSSRLTASGSGSGPFVASYTLSGSEPQPLKVSASFSNSNGSMAQTYLWVGDSAINTPMNTSVATLPSSGNSVGSTPGSVDSEQFTQYLYAGMTAQNVSNPQVKALQERLKTGGFFTGSATGYFGERTKAAVEAYQEKHGLTSIGVVGPATRTLLNKGI
jgi:hypothetical protein